jgi:hypothetical protein
LGIAGVTARLRPQKKEFGLWRAGKMAESSPLLQELSPASNGICEPTAKITIDPPITSAQSVDPKTTLSPHESVSNYEKIVTPLSADGFNTLLHHYNLMLQYPTLSLDLRNSFPLGEFDTYLSDSYNHPNHSNALPHTDRIASYIQDEVTGGRMSGPFTWDELKKEARGNVIVSPLGAVDKAGEPGKLRITCNLSFKGKAPFSVNDRIDKDAFSTKWGTAATIIDLVSLLIPKIHFISPYQFFGHDGTFRRLYRLRVTYPRTHSHFTHGEVGLVTVVHTPPSSEIVTYGMLANAI